MIPQTRGLAQLRDQLRHRSVVIVAGSGVSTAATDNADTANWAGLLRDGVAHCQEFGVPRLTEEYSSLLEELIATGDIDLLLAAATVVEARLGGKEGAEWRRWLTEAIGKLRAIDWDLPLALQALDVPLLTTNYDDILRTGPNGLTIPAVTWRRPDQWVEVLARRADGVLHLHGWWGDPESVVLGVRSYDEILRQGAAQEIQRALGRFNTLLFVGCGATIRDPNLGPLISWLGEAHGPNHRHYILLKSDEVSVFDGPASLHPISYGPTTDFLPAFLHDLQTPRAPGLVLKRDSVAVFQNFEEFTETSEAVVPRMVVIPAGSFQMGGTPGSVEANEELPRHQVTIDYSFAVSKYPVTFDEWDAYERASGTRLRPKDNGWGRGRRPVIHVSWDDVQGYLEWLNGLSFVEGTYRLLSEAEWEYVARAGTTGATWWGGPVDSGHANYDASEIGRTTEVDGYPPNPFGIYDMLGNVWEWVADFFHTDYKGAPRDGSAWIESVDNRRTIRGGCWYYDERFIECGARLGIDGSVRFNSVGFRVARTIRQTLSDGATYIITSVNSGLVATADEDGRVRQYPASNGTKQMWRAVHIQEDVFYFESAATGLVLSVLDPADKNSAWAGVQPRVEGDQRQDWRAEPSGDGYILTNVGSGKVLDVDNISLSEGAKIMQFAKHGNANQRWWVRNASIAAGAAGEQGKS